MYELTEGQVSFKDENAKLSLIRTAGFPYNKTFEDFDFTYQPSLNKKYVLDLKNLRFIEKKENILLIGSSRVGKTHLAISTGIESTIITSNINFNKWGELFKDSVIASAILDRLLHHSIIYNITGNSYRIKDKIEPTEQNEDKKQK